MPNPINRHPVDGRNTSSNVFSQDVTGLSYHITNTIEHLKEIRDTIEAKGLDYYFGNDSEDVDNAIESPSFNNGSHDSFAKAIDLCRSRLTAVSDAGEGSKTAALLVQDLEKETFFFISKAQDVINAVEKEKMRLIMVRGLSGLPEELLRLVFEEVQEPGSNRPWMVPFRLSAVCRRFRNIVISTPALWSSVSTEVRRREAFDILLGRSRDAVLKIGFLGKRQYAADDFSTVLKPHSNRWSSLKIYLQDDSDIDAIFSGLEPNALPRLNDVTVSSTTTRTQLIKFVQYWNDLAPNLRTLDLHILTQSQYTLPSSLRRLELTISESTDSAIGSTRDLVALLQSAPVLEDITLDIRTLEAYSDHHGGRDKIVKMPNVAKLSLKMGALRGLKPLLHGIYFPNLRELYFALTEKFKGMYRGRRGRWGVVDPIYGPGDDVGSGLHLVDELLLSSKTYENLTSLSLKLHFPEEAKQHDYGVGFMENIFVNCARNCPSLEHLTLETTILIKYMNLPPLLTLRLKRCNLQSTKFLKDHEYKVADRVEINQCGFVSGSWDDLKFDDESKLILLDPKRGRLDSRW